MSVRLVPGRARAAVLGIALAASALACTAPAEEIQLGPLFARGRAAGGGAATDALLGAWISHEPMPSNSDDVSGLRPLVSHRHRAGEAWTYYLVPLGRHRVAPDVTSSMLAPLFFYLSHTKPTGEVEWDLVTLIGIMLSKRPGESARFAWFPFGGTVQFLFTFDRITFVLFPLYIRFERGETKYTNVIFPVFGWTRGPHEWGIRFWPLYADQRRDDGTRRRFWLWPIFHHHRELPVGSPIIEDKFLIWPLFGRTRQGTYRAYSTLWPFFGYAYDPRAAFWALDAPWPFVRLQGGGQSPRADERTRIWPLYSHYKADRLTSDSVLWPIFYVRHEEYLRAERRTFYALPFVQRWKRTADTGEVESSFEKYWPFYQSYLDEFGTRRSTVLALNPIQRNETFEFHYSWLWELYSIEEGKFGLRERALWGLWHRERDEREERTAVGPLLSSRAFHGERGETSETSLLFGLLRMRSSDRDGFQILRPSFPGPGWPIEDEAPQAPEAPGETGEVEELPAAPAAPATGAEATP